ncbi:MAG: DNA recombination protein RmuC [Rikenellaceae bacterium]
MIVTIVLFVAGLLLGGMAMFVSGRAKMQKHTDLSSQEILELTRDNATLAANVSSLKDSLLQAKQDATLMENDYKQRAQKQDAAFREQLELMQKRAKEDQLQIQERVKAEFAVLADKIMADKSDQFKRSNRESMEQMLQPFRENIEAFRKRVEEVYISESQQRTSLKEQIKQLSEMNTKMSVEANNLVAALKGNSKTQGDWGEMILETMLEASGLHKGVHYLTQQNFKDETGANKRPDVVIKLPDNKSIIVDSKVSIKSYVAYTESDDKEVMARAIKEHLLSVRRHVDELATKGYPELIGDTAPDMVIMFIPNEPAFLLALQNDSDLWRYAYERKVMISSPTNLFAVLKIVDDLWKRDLQSKNAINIALESSRLYDKFVGFAESLSDLGRSIDNTSKKYDDAMGKLKTGRGNLIGRVEKLRKLGVRASKQMPEQFLDYDDNEGVSLE